MSRPLAIDLFCGLGGWTEGLMSEGFDVIGFDVEQHVYGTHRYPAQLVLQDVRTIHGSQFKDASLIVASSPCQKYSYMAMPWTRAKEQAKWYRDPAHPERLAELNELFDQPARIQREACEAAGRFIPMVQENVCGAQPWVGRAQWHYGSYYLWGDVPALMPTTLKAQKFNPDGTAHPPGSWFAIADSKDRGARATKNDGGSWFAVAHNTTSGKGRNPDGRKLTCEIAETSGARDHSGIKQGGTWFHDTDSASRRSSSKSKARKAASARIAKIPLPLAQWIGHCYHPARLVGDVA
jgi:hypothetical protein